MFGGLEWEKQRGARMRGAPIKTKEVAAAMTRSQEVILTISHRPICANARTLSNCHQVNTYVLTGTQLVGVGNGRD